MDDKLQQTIMGRIKDQKIYSKTHFQIIGGLMLLVICILLGLGIFSLTFFFWDSIHIIDHPRINPSPVEDLIQFGLFELILITVFISYVVYALLRRLDLSVSRFRAYMSISLIVLIIGVSIGASIAIDNFPPAQRFFDRANEGVQKLPHRRNRDRLGPKPHTPNRKIIFHNRPLQEQKQ